VKYALIRRNRRVWPIRVQCRMLGVSVAGYHEHLVGRLQIARRRHLSAESLLVHIGAVYAANRGAYGWPRIWRELHAQGVRVGKQRVQRLMQQHGRRRPERHMNKCRHRSCYRDCVGSLGVIRTPFGIGHAGGQEDSVGHGRPSHAASVHPASATRMARTVLMFSSSHFRCAVH
jgi:hypothetical protein